MSDLKYPYGFAPFSPNAPSTSAPLGHDDYSGKSGTLKCTMTTLTPLLIRGEETEFSDGDSENTPYLSIQERGETILPGSSLKGVVRSVFEVLTNSCVGVHKKRYSDDHQEGFRMVPDTHLKCDERQNLCPACRAFGFVEDEGQNCHKGCVHIGQAHTSSNPSRADTFRLPALYGPCVTKEEGNRELLNERYYGTPENPNGRKFYRHHRAFENRFSHVSEENMCDYVQPLAEETEFQFQVSFENLAPRSLSALVAALTLSDNARTGDGTVKVRHKIGYGKPAGLGSVRIEIERAVLETDPEERYRRFDVSPEEKTGAPLETWVKEKRQRFFGSSRPSTRALARVLQWPPDPDVDVTYDADPPDSSE